MKIIHSKLHCSDGDYFHFPKAKASSVVCIELLSAYIIASAFFWKQSG
jgi:hypothetical protein